MRRLLASLVLFFAFCFVSCAQESVLQEGLGLKYLVQYPEGHPKNAPVIILLHGFGSNEKDLFELRAVLPKKYIIVAPRAPLSAGRQGYMWYQGINIGGHHKDGNKDDIARSKALLEAFIPQVVAKVGGDPRQVYLMGFSQGAVMTYLTGLAIPEKLKGIAPLSGEIFENQKPNIKITPAAKKLRIFVSHGTEDEPILFADGKASADYLKAQGLKPEFHKYVGMPHSISKDVIYDLQKWLQ